MAATAGAEQHPRVVGVVLAAGAGSRFGSPKALAVYRGRLLIELAVATLVAGGCDDVVAVLGAAAADVEAQARLDGVRVVWNTDWAQGMSTSLRAGLTACAGADAAIVALVDQPGVTVAVVRRLIEHWKSSSRPVAVAAYDGEPRNPVLFAAPVWPDVQAGVHGDVGARAWLRAHPELVTAVEVGDVGDSTDIDTPDDLMWPTD